jgi:beta-lactamase regulating signal transducer with metallopeptidase domain
MTDLVAGAASLWSALLETLPLGIVLAAAVAAALWPARGLTPSTRHAVWLMTLLTVAVLPLTRVFWAPVAYLAASAEAPAVVPAKAEFHSGLPAVPASLAGRSDTLRMPLQEDRSGRWDALASRLLLPAWPPLPKRAVAALTLLWVGIVCALFLRAGLALASLFRMKAEGDLLPPPMQGWIASLLRLRACRRRTEARSHPLLSIPVTAGFSAPAILVPLDMVRRLPQDHLRRIVLHEAAHVLRRDDWTHLLEHLLRALLFFHPAVWWIGRRMQLEREMACDALVVEATGDARGYAQCLLTVAELASRSRVRFPVPAVGRHPSQLTRRITMIIDRHRPLPPTLKALVLGASALVLALALAQCTLAPREAQAAVHGVAPAAIASPAPAAVPAPPAPAPAPVPAAASRPPKPADPPPPPTPPDLEALEGDELPESYLHGPDREELLVKMEQAMKKAEQGLREAQEKMQFAEQRLLAEQVRLQAAQRGMEGTARRLSEEEMAAMEAELEALGESIEKKVEARMEGIEWEKLEKEEAAALARERLQGLDGEIKTLTEKAKELSGQAAFQARLRALPEIEEALKEIRKAQEELKFEQQRLEKTKLKVR